MRRLPFLLVVSAVTVTSAKAQGTADSTAGAGKSVWKGVYTEEQASRGDAEHQNNCTSCHGAEKYAGEAFAKNWVGRTVFDLFDQIKTTMPDDNPGGLTAQQYKDIVAYILKTNGIPAGTDSLPGDPEAMRLLKIDLKPDKQTSLRPMYHPHAVISPTATR
jgi:cytochrome c1